MSAAEHEATANQEQASGETHAGQYDPQASVAKKECGPARAGTVCWTSEVNPTREHAKDAERHRELASQHRAASEALRAAEASACSGIPEDDRDASPFTHAGDIRSVSPLQEQVQLGRGSATQRTAGAEIVFQAVPGMTAEWLQRVVDCHLARNAAIGHEVATAEMGQCPLTLRGAQAKVRSVGDGFAVDVRADDEATQKEIVRMAESLKASANL
jgi:hypothetical protein